MNSPGKVSSFSPLKVSKLLGTLLRAGDTQRLLLVVIKVAGVARSFAFGNEGSLHLQKESRAVKVTMRTWRLGLDTDLPLVDSYPVRRLEPLVSFDVVDRVLQIAVTLGQVDLQQIPQQVFEVGAEVGGEAHLFRDIKGLDELVRAKVKVAVAGRTNHLSGHDFLVDLDGLISKERGVTGSHFIHQDAQSPPIHRFVVTLEMGGKGEVTLQHKRRGEGLNACLAEDDFRGQVFRGATQGPGSALHSLGKAKVCHLAADSSVRAGANKSLINETNASDDLLTTALGPMQVRSETLLSNDINYTMAYRCAQNVDLISHVITLE